MLWCFWMSNARRSLSKKYTKKKKYLINHLYGISNSQNRWIFFHFKTTSKSWQNVPLRKTKLKRKSIICFCWTYMKKLFIMCLKHENYWVAVESRKWKKRWIYFLDNVYRVGISEVKVSASGRRWHQELNL